MKSHHRGAALTALCCLWSACGDGIHVAPQAGEPGRRAEVTPEGEDLLGHADGTQVPDPDAPTTTVDAPLEAWPLDLTAADLGAIDGALFLGDALIIAGRSADQVIVRRLHRSIESGAAKVAARSATDRFLALRPAASRITLSRVGADVVATWIADGHLEGVRIAASSADLEALTPLRLSGEEGGQLSGDPVIAEAADPSAGIVACATDTLGPLCFGLDATLSPIAVHALTKRRSAGTPRALLAIEDGFMLVLGSCKGATCARMDLTAIALALDGKPGKVRDLPVVQLDRGTAFIPEDDGFVLVARRVGAGEHTAWRVTEQGLRELDGRFSRVVGGFAHEGRTLLVERDHLKMRKGFPVRGFVVRPLEEASSRKAKKPTREALPEAVADLLPTEADQDFAAHGDALVFAAPTRKGRLRATVVRLLDGP